MMESFRKYTVKHFQRIMLVFIACTLGAFSIFIPYLNVILDPVWVIILLLIFIKIVLPLPLKVYIFFVFALAILALPWLAVGSRVAAEWIGVAMYVSVALVLFQEMKHVREHIKK